MIASGGGDGLRLINGINWQEITLWDGKGEIVSCFKEMEF